MLNLEMLTDRVNKVDINFLDGTLTGVIGKSIEISPLRRPMIKNVPVGELIRKDQA